MVCEGIRTCFRVLERDQAGGDDGELTWLSGDHCVMGQGDSGADSGKDSPRVVPDRDGVSL